MRSLPLLAPTRTMAFAGLVLLGLVVRELAAPPFVAAPSLVALLLGTGAVAFIARQTWEATQPPVRTVVIGSRAATEALAAELLARRSLRYEVIGRLGPASGAGDDGTWLGPLDDIDAVIERHAVDLLLLGSGMPRMAVFDALDRCCDRLTVRLCELSEFYEEHFGHIPLAEINSAWFQCVMHPRHPIRTPPVKRAFDLVIATVMAVSLLPLLLVLALLIRRDGAPALYRQVRLGERGKPFSLLKLRTMRVDAAGATTWSHADDDRVTPLGRMLRRTHIDELPQLLNVLRGEMTIVGPRPEQPQYVAALERILPHYTRRHQVRPGLTGWAQVNCGYGGSQQGSLWKLSHDLYYLKHASVALDVKILVRTVALAAQPLEFGEPQLRPFVFGFPRDDAPPEPAPLTVAPEAGPPLALADVPAQLMDGLAG